MASVSGTPPYQPQRGTQVGNYQSSDSQQPDTGPSQPSSRDLQLNSAKQVSSSRPVSFGKAIANWFNNTLNYIGERPIEFAFSVAAGMAMRFAVTAGLFSVFAISGGLPALALTMAASMITSVVLEVGKKLVKGEKISGKDLLKNAAISGLFSGVIGSLFGEFFAADPPDQTLGPASDAHALRVDPSQQYAWRISGIADIENHLGNAGETCQIARAFREIDLRDFVESDKDWLVLQDGYGNPYHTISHEQAAELIEKIEHEAEIADIEPPEKIILRNVSSANAASIAEFDTDASFLDQLLEQENLTFSLEEHRMEINSGLLEKSRDAVDYVLGHEIGHAHDAVCNTTEYVQSHLNGDHHLAEIDADDHSILNGGHHKGSLDWFISEVYENPDKLDLEAESHPSNRFRIENLIRQTACEADLTPEAQAEFIEHLKAHQIKLNQEGIDLNLLSIWEELRDEHITPTIDPDRAHEIVDALDLGKTFNAEENISHLAPDMLAFHSKSYIPVEGGWAQRIRNEQKAQSNILTSGLKM